MLPNLLFQQMPGALAWVEGSFCEVEAVGRLFQLEGSDKSQWRVKT